VDESAIYGKITADTCAAAASISALSVRRCRSHHSNPSWRGASGLWPDGASAG